jgi:hypothetical protein
MPEVHSYRLKYHPVKYYPAKYAAHRVKIPHVVSRACPHNRDQPAEFVVQPANALSAVMECAYGCTQRFRRQHVQYEKQDQQRVT